MKRKYIFGSAVAVALGMLATSCEKSEPTLGGAEKSDMFVTITVSDDVDTRVDMDGFDVDWAVGDEMLFYNSSSTNAATISTASELSVESVSAGSAVFSGEVSSSLLGGKVSGFYPTNGYRNWISGTNALSSLRVAQPTYFQLEYDSTGALTPASMGKYCYIHFQSNESLSADVNELTGTLKHIVAYMDLNFKNVSSKAVERVYIAADQAEGTMMAEAVVSADGSVDYDTTIDYIGNAEGDSSFTYASLGTFDINYFIFELYDSNGDLGVTPSNGELQVRLPLFPQTIAGAWDLYVVYADGTEDVITITHNSTDLVAGSCYNSANSIDLSGATTLAKVTAKKGDYYWTTDNSYATVVTGSETTCPDAIVYDLAGTGVDRKAGKGFSTVYYRKYVIRADSEGRSYGTDGYDGYVNTASNSKNTNLTTTGIYNGIVAMQDFLNDAMTATDETTAKLQSHSDQSFAGLFEEFSPCYSAIYSRSTAYQDVQYSADAFDGTEVNLWYLPTAYEVYDFVCKVNELQSLKSNYYSNQHLKLNTVGLIPGTNPGNSFGTKTLAAPMSIGTDGVTITYGSSIYAEGSSSYGNALDLTNTDPDVEGPLFDTILPQQYETSGVVSGGTNYNFRTATFADGGNLYMRVQSIYMSPTSSYLGTTATFSATTAYQPVWPMVTLDSACATQLQ
ncbi:MAG: hypothetical protein SNF68_00185 [Rikenellaceae bacterium]